jgi:hypothetical protein
VWQTFNDSEMERSSVCTGPVRHKMLDTADIVIEAMFHQLELASQWCRPSFNCGVGQVLIKVAKPLGRGLHLCLKKGQYIGSPYACCRGTEAPVSVWMAATEGREDL